MANSQEILFRAVSDAIYLDKPRGFDEIKEEIGSVKIEDITGAVDKYLGREVFYTTILAPLSFQD